MPCAAPAERGQPETRRAARDSNIRLSFSLSASTARRRAQGDPIQASSLSLAQGHARSYRIRQSLIRWNGAARRVLVRQTKILALCLTAVFGPVARRRRHGVATGVRRTAPVRTACLRIAKAIRVLYASRRRCVSECTGVAGAVPGCLFPLLTFFWTSKRK